MKRIEIQEKCDKIIEMIKEINNSADQKEMIKTITAPLKDRVKEIKKICSVEKYNLCFIGEVGVGKSTAISHLFGLIDESKLKEGNKMADISILKTASGRTTLCKTEIEFTDYDCSRIIIEEEDNETLKGIIKDICTYIVKIQNEDHSEQDGAISSEIMRAVENMAGINLRKSDEEKLTEYVIKSSGEEKLRESGLRQALEDTIYKKINSEVRTKKKIECHDLNNQYSWLKDKLKKINDGEEENVPYPKKVILQIAKKHLNLSVPDFIGRIIDTKGLDDESVREDISSVINNERNICIICDKITSYGSMVSRVPLKNEFIAQKKDLKYRTVVLGLEKHGELSDVNEAEGDRELGKDIKKEEALQHWNSLCLDEDNMMFYNSLTGINVNGKNQIISVEETEYDQERGGVLKSLTDYILNIREVYNDELTQMESNISGFAGNNPKEEHKQKLNEFREIVVNGLSKVNSDYNLLSIELSRRIGRTHAGRVRACVNRNGKYDKFNVYDEAKDISYEEYDNALQELYSDLLDECERIFKDEKDGITVVLGGAIKYKIAALYNEKRKENAELYYRTLRDNLYEDQIWKEMQGYWGSGLPYRDSVSDTFNNRYKEKGIKEKIEAKNISSNYINDLIEYLTL